jgi:hypothetical protein
MAVHHFTAVNLNVEPAAGWRQIETFPTDGSIVEVCVPGSTKTAKAMWREGRVVVEPSGPQQPTHWRPITG